VNEFVLFRLVRKTAHAACFLLLAAAPLEVSAAPQSSIAPTGPTRSKLSADATTPLCTVEKMRSGWRARMADGRLLFDRWQPSTAAPSGFLAPSAVRVTPVLNGASIEYEFSNTGAAAATPMDLELPTLQIISSPRIMDASFLGEARAIPTTATPWIGGVYPRDLYSPVTAMSWTGGAVGVSVIYPILEYQHDVAVVIRNTGSGRWQPLVALSNSKVGGHFSTSLKYEATVPPGGKRTYRVEIRATTNRGWLETLEPYRQFFHRTYGSVRYARDGRNIYAVQTAVDEYRTASNPEGWAPEAGRPDLSGYGAVAGLMRHALLRADRIILWTPTGMHVANRQRDYPFKFVSRWFEPGAPLPMRSAPSVFATISLKPNQRWGLWWGHAAEVQSTWDSASFSPISLADTHTMGLAKRELDLAVTSGARIVGLDAFTHHASPLWELHPWLARMTSENPQVTFCTEGRNPDIMHALAPTWIDAYGWSKYQPNGPLITGRFVLADWLLPGHETWAGVMWNRADRTELRTEVGGAARRAEIDRLRTLGFVPVLFGD